MVQRSTFFAFVATTCWGYVATAHAQDTSTSQDDDVEVPAAPANATSAPPSAAPPANPQLPAAAPVASQPNRDAELAELKRRLAALEAAQANANASRSEGEAARAAGEKRPAKEAPAALPFGIRVGGYIQGQFETNRLSQDQLQQGGDPLNQDRFSLRRARLVVDRSWKYAAGTLELDANTVRGPNVGIRRAEATLLYRASEALDQLPLVAATFGITDIPFGFEIGESARTRPFMERSLGSLALFPTEADAGVKLWGAVSFLRYGLALMNGEPLDTRGFPRDPNAAKDLVGRVGFVANPLSNFSISGGTSFAKGKGFHSGQDATKDSLAWVDLDGRSTVTLAELLGIKAVSATPSQNFERWALGLDLRLSLKTQIGETLLYGEAFVASNYDRGLAHADPIATGFDVRHLGAFAGVVQGVTRHGFVGFRFGYYDPNSDVLEQRRNRFVPVDLSLTTFSPLIGFVLPGQAKIALQYDFIRDNLARDTRGVPADAANDVFTLRAQVEL
ncbi:MAG: hypothetical protein ACOY0T_30330 [Myxococcota bacterium]